MIDEFTRECLAIRVARRINSLGVIETLANVMLTKGIPEHIRSDNGAEMTSRIVRNWLAGPESKTLYIELAANGRTDIASPSTANRATNA